MDWTRKVDPVTINLLLEKLCGGLEGVGKDFCLHLPAGNMSRYCHNCHQGKIQMRTKTLLLLYNMQFDKISKKITIRFRFPAGPPFFSNTNRINFS